MLLSLNLLTELRFAFPDILTAIFMTALIFYRVFSSASKHIAKLSTLFSFICFMIILIYRNTPGNKFNSSLFVYNQSLQDIKLILFALTTLGFFVSNFIKSISVDFYVFIFGFINAISICLTSNNFLCLFLGLELYTFSLVFALLNNHEEPFENLKNCALRFILLSSIMGAIFLFGCSLLYSQFGSLSYQRIFLNKNFESITGTVLILAYILFKFGIAPFHSWLIDVYEKSSFLVVMFLDSIWKLFLSFIFLKVFSIFILDKFYDYQTLFEVVAIISMIFGATAPLFQGNINKFVASSSVGHMGFAFGVFAIAKNLNSVASVPCYLLYYSVSSVCFFICILIIKKIRNIKNFSDIAGIINTMPLLGVLILISMFSMIGIPPFGNFLAKLNIFKLFIQSHNYLLLSISAIYSILSIVYTAKLSRNFFMKTNNPIFVDISNLVLLLPILILVFLGLFYPSIEKLFTDIILKM